MDWLLLVFSRWGWGKECVPLPHLTRLWMLVLLLKIFFRCFFSYMSNKCYVVVRPFSEEEEEGEEEEEEEERTSSSTSLSSSPSSTTRKRRKNFGGFSGMITSQWHHYDTHWHHDDGSETWLLSSTCTAQAWIRTRSDSNFLWGPPTANAPVHIFPRFPPNALDYPNRTHINVSTSPPSAWFEFFCEARVGFSDFGCPRVSRLCCLHFFCEGRSRDVALVWEERNSKVRGCCCLMIWWTKWENECSEIRDK